MLAGIAQQQRPRMDELGGRRLAAARQCFQPAAFFFGECNFISGCHPPIIHHGMTRRQYAKYNVLHGTSTVQSFSRAKGSLDEMSVTSPMSN